MTIKEMLESTEAVLRPVDIAPVLRCDPQYIRITARERPEALGFPTVVIGTRTKIPRVPFLRYLGYLNKDGQPV